MEEDEVHDQLEMNLNSQSEGQSEGEKYQWKEGDPPTPRIKWPTAASKK